MTIKMKNFNSSDFFNKFEKYKFFSNDCVLYYRLCIVTSLYPTWALENIANIYYRNGHVQLYKDANDLMNLFSPILKQKVIYTDNTLEQIKSSISEGQYILGLFDTYYMPNNCNFNKVHNYNSFLAYGICQEQIYLFASKDIHGAQKLAIGFKDFTNMTRSIESQYINISDRELTKLGFPLSTQQINFAYTSDANKRFYNVSNFFLKCEDNRNCNILGEEFLNYIVNSLLTMNPDLYNSIFFSINIVIDFFLILKENLIYLKLQSVLSDAVDVVIKEIRTVFSLCAKYLFTSSSHILQAIIHHYENASSAIHVCANNWRELYE